MSLKLHGLFLVVGGLAAAACDDRRGPPSPADLSLSPPAPPAASLAKLLGVDAGELDTPVDPPAPAGDLKAEIEHFTTLDACVAERARLDPLVGDALEAIGYDTFLRDACRIIEAAKANDAARCSAIDATALEALCRTTVAEIAAAPDTCPWEAPGRPARGREARCLAIATRDVRLCAGALDALARASCEATLGGDERPCTKLRTRAEQARCSRDSARWRGLVSGRAPVADTPPVVPAGTLHVEPLDAHAVSGAASGPLDVDLRPDLEHGVTLVVDGEGTRFVVGPLSEAGLDFIAPSPHVRGSLALELLVASGSRKMPTVARVERAELVVPGRPAASTPGATSTLTAKVTSLAPTRGAPVALEIEGDISAAASSWRVRAQATTFVRDVVRSSDVYNGAATLPRDLRGAGREAPRLGVDAGMR
jgi:hypothetical protein